MSTKPLVQCLQDEISTAIDKYRDEGITTAEAIGVLEIIKIGVYDETLVDDDDDDDILKQLLNKKTNVQTFVCCNTTCARRRAPGQYDR